VIVGTLAGVILLVGVAGVAKAVSGGGYRSSQQDCPANADSTAAGTGTGTPANPVPGCHNLATNVDDGHNRYAEVGLDQLPVGDPSTPGLTGVGYPQSGNFPHSGCAAANTDGTGGGTGTGCGNNPKGAGGSANLDTNSLVTCAYDNVWLPDPTNLSPPPSTPPSATCTPGSNPSGAVSVTPDTGSGTTDLATTALAPNGGLNFYTGADDNLDAGEHDGVTGTKGTAKSINGPSDGGAVSGHVTPGRATKTPTGHNPVPVAGASVGFCADGVCLEATTEQQAVYHGGGGGGSSRDVYNYAGKQWDPYNCSSGSPDSEATGCKGAAGKPQTMDGWRQTEAGTVNAEPGVQVYEDPDPQGSPIDPVYEGGGPLTLYPLVGGYAGTCGVVAGGGPVAAVPASPLTNSAGQVVVDPGTCH
jgi:hypothetical protein